jgi:hypothetical protein
VETASLELSDPASGFLAMTRAVMSYGWEMPRRYEFIFHDPIVEVVRGDPSLHSTRLASMITARELIGRARSIGLFRTDMSIDDMVVCSLATTQGFCELIVSQRSTTLFSADFDQLASTAMNYVREGMMAR